MHYQPKTPSSLRRVRPNISGAALLDYLYFIVFCDSFAVKFKAGLRDLHFLSLSCSPLFAYMLIVEKSRLSLNLQMKPISL